MEVIMSSPVQECSVMKVDKGDGVVKLTKSRKPSRKIAKRNAAELKDRMNANLESFDKREDTDTGLAKTASSAGTTGDEKSSISLSSLQDNAYSVIGTTANLNAEVKVENKMETAVGENGSGTKATDNSASKKRKKTRKKKNPESGTTATVDHNNKMLTSSATGDEKSLISKIEPSSGEMGSSMTTDLNAEVKVENKMATTVGETGSGTNETDNTVSKKRKRTRKKKNPESGTTVTADKKNRVLISSATGDEKSLISKIEPSSGEMGSSMTTNLNAEVKIENKMETTVGETGSGTNKTNNTVSKKRKRQKKKKKNLESCDVLSTRDYTQDKTTTPGDEKSSISGMEIDKGNDAVKLSKSQSLDKREDTENTKSKPEIVFYTISLSSLQDNQFSGIDTTATDNTASKERKRKTKNKKNPVSGDVLSTYKNTQDKTASPGDEKSSISGMEIDKGNDAVKFSKSQSLDKREDTENAKSKPEIGFYTISLSSLQDNQFSGIDTTATDNTASKERKRKTKKKKNQVSGDVLSTCENTQDKPATPGDEKSLISGMEIDKGNNCPVKLNKTQNGNLKRLTIIHELRERTRKWKESQKEKLASAGNLSKAKEEKRKPKSKKTRQPTLGEILNPRYLELLEGGTNSKKSEKRKRQKLNKKNRASAGIVSTNESAQDTGKSLEALSTELKTEDRPKTFNVEKGPSTIVDADGTILKDIACTEVATISEPADLEIAEAKENTSLPIKMVKQYVKVQEKKLVIFDVNGLLADFVSPPPKDMIADFRIPNRAIFKRPFLDDFLRFCFDRFHVGIWSSRTMQNLDPVVNFLLGDLKKKLLFLWDASKCTNSGMRTLEDRHKHLFLKDLRKIWEKNDPNKSWVRGSFNDTNTLLLDDSPYKALVNPKHSGIFPVSYSYKNRDDNFLGPKGELQNYLEGLAGSDNVMTYVEQHPFGVGAIDESHPDWTYYARVLKGQTR